MPGLHDLVASTFELGRPLHELRQVQVSAYETWRLDTSRGSFLAKRLWNGDGPPWLSEYEISMDLEHRARQAGIATAIPVMPVEPAFGWAGRVDGHGVWRVYEWLEHTEVDAAEIEYQWFGETLSLLHKLYPLDGRFEPEWRWLGVYPRSTWERWLATSARLGKVWATTVEAYLDRILAITENVRDAHETATDHVVSHRDFGPWNVLKTADGLVLIDWESAGPTTASAELGRAVAAFGQDDPVRMRSLIEMYQNSGGTIVCRTDDLFIWQLTQHLSGLTERIKIALRDIDEYDDLEPVWMNAATIDQDIIDAVVKIPSRMIELVDLARQLRWPS